MFDNKAWTEAYIESETFREYMESTGFCFSDAEMATITFNSGKPLHTMHQTLEELAEYTEDHALKKEIQERIAYDRHCLNLFESNGGFFYRVISCADTEQWRKGDTIGDFDTLELALEYMKDKNTPFSVEQFGNNKGFFYQVVANADTEQWDCGDTIGHFASVELALGYMMNKKIPFSIEKYQIIGLCERIIKHKVHWNPYLFPGKSAEKRPYDGHAIGSCSYDADGILLRCWTEEISDEEQDKVDDWGAARFEHHYIALPNPFERGDLVCYTNAVDAIGVVETSQVDWLAWEKRVREQELKLDFFDASITVEFPTERGTFSHDHISPIYLKKIDPIVLDGDDRKELLEVAGRMLNGQASLDWNSHVCEDYRQKKQSII